MILGFRRIVVNDSTSRDRPLAYLQQHQPEAQHHQPQPHKGEDGVVAQGQPGRVVAQIEEAGYQLCAIQRVNEDG